MAVGIAPHADSARTAASNAGRVIVKMSFFIGSIPSLHKLFLPGRLAWVLRGTFHGFAKEAMTLGFPHTSFDRFGFVGVAAQLSIAVVCGGFREARQARKSSLNQLVD